MELDKAMVKNIFITGATGCIGSYISEQLINNNKYHLFLLVRNPDRLLPNVINAKNVEIVKGDMAFIELASKDIAKADYIINIATSWGGAKQSNVNGVSKMLSFVDKFKFKKFIQFETASILGHENALLEEASTDGTGYIKCKYDIYHITKNHPLSDKIIRVYPTVVIGGAQDRPYSHISKGLLNFHKQLKWLKRIYIDFGFHFMHSEDIAKCVIHIMKNVENENDLVLGNDYISLKDFIKQATEYYNQKAILKFKIPSWFINLIIKLNLVKMSSWDKFCFSYKFFKYNTVNCKTYGLSTDKDTVKGIFDDIETNR